MSDSREEGKEDMVERVQVARSRSNFAAMATSGRHPAQHSLTQYKARMDGLPDDKSFFHAE